MAGGVPAGRLSIELVAEIARLQADLDKAKRMVKAASKGIADDARAANDNLANIGKGSKLASHHVTNLAFQFQDLGLQMQAAAMSSNPLKMAFTAILQQGSQIAGIMMQAGIGVRGLATEVGGMIGRFLMAHPILAAIGVAAGVLYGAFKLFQSQVEKSGEITAYANSLGLTHKEMKKLKDVTVTVGDSFVGLWRTIDQGLGVGKILTAIKDWIVDTFNTGLQWAQNFGSAVWAVFQGTASAAITMAQAAKKALTGDFAGAWAAVKTIPQGYVDAFKGAQKAQSGFFADWKRNSIQAAKDRLKGQADAIIADRAPKSDSRAETLAREMQATEALITGLNKLADAYGVSEAAGLREEITAKATAEAIKKQADVATYVAQQIRLMVAERTRDAAKDLAGMSAQTAARKALNDQVAAGILTSEQAAVQLQNESQLRPYIVAMDLAEGAAKAKLVEIIEKLRAAQKAANGEAIRTQELQVIEQRNKSTELIKKEIELTEQLGARRLAALTGLHGQALRDELAAINVEQEKAAIFMRAQAEAADLLKKGMGGAAAAVLAEAKAAGRLVEVKAEIRQKEEAAANDRKRLVETAATMGDIIGGKIGSAISQLADLLDRIAPGISAALGKSFQALDQQLGNLFRNAGIGAAAASATGGNAIGGLVGGSVGGKIGDKLGSKVAEKLGGTAFGKALGEFAGPLGSIAGGILGGVIGGLFKKVKKGSQTIEIMAGEAMKTSLTGNSAKLKAAASKMADGLISGLLSIADQLGGDLGNGIKVSIGQRDKTFRVDLQGLGRTKNMPKFDTEAEAIAFAIQEVIKQGAIIGLRAGTETLLKGQGDLEAQLQKAVTFENVFKELEQRANPAKASIDEIAKSFTKLIDIFDEAKATTDDYAKLQQLMAVKMREVIEQGFEPIRNLLDDLKSKAATAGDALKSAYQDVLSRQESAVQAYNDALAAQQSMQADAIGDALNSVRSDIEKLTDAANRLREFSDSIFASESGGNAVARFQELIAAAKGGNADALTALPGAGQDAVAAIKANSTDRVSMLRALAEIRAQTDEVAASTMGRANALSSQAAALEQQISALKSINDSATSIEQLLAEMQSATEAADLAREQMDKLTELTDVQLTFADAVKAYEDAKAARDDLIREITAAGFADLITVQQQSGSQMVAALANVAAQVAAATSQAAAAIAAAQTAQAAMQAANDNNPWSAYLNQIPQFAAGGLHRGGLRIVGENGPELEATGPARYYSAADTASMLGSAGNEQDLAKAIAAELKPLLKPIILATAKSASIHRRWEGDGMPETRSVA